MKVMLLLLTIFVLASCKRESETEKLMLKNGGKWLYYNSEKYNPASKFISYLKFEEEKCDNYYIESDNHFSDVDSPSDNKTWSYSESDSILTIFRNKFKTSQIKTDTLYLYNIKDKTHAMLFRYVPKKKAQR